MSSNLRSISFLRTPPCGCLCCKQNEEILNGEVHFLRGVITVWNIESTSADKQQVYTKFTPKQYALIYQVIFSRFFWS